MESAEQSRIWTHFQNAKSESFAGAKPRLDFLLKQIRSRHHGIPHVLNVGVGDGYFERQALAEGWHIESVDPDEQAIKRLQVSGIKAHVGLIEKLPLPSDSQDFVVASEVLEHLSVEQREGAIIEIFRVLKQGGYFIGTVPFAEDLEAQHVICPACSHQFHRWGHQRAFILDDVRKMLGASFLPEALSKTAFVDLWGRGLRGLVKGAVRIALAKMGSPIAIPTIWWAAKKLKL